MLCFQVCVSRQLCREQGFLCNHCCQSDSPFLRVCLDTSQRNTKSQDYIFHIHHTVYVTLYVYGKSISAFKHDVLKHYVPTFCMFCLQRIESPLWKQNVFHPKVKLCDNFSQYIPMDLDTPRNTAILITTDCICFIQLYH